MTLVELFAALAILAVVLSFASSPLERMSARVDVDVAHENFSHMLSIARRAAVKHQLPVVISVTKRFGKTHLEASYSYRWRNLRLDPIPSFSLASGVGALLEDGSSVIRLEEDGFTRKTQHIRFFSEVHPDYMVEARIEGAGANDHLSLVSAP